MRKEIILYPCIRGCDKRFAGICFLKNIAIARGSRVVVLFSISDVVIKNQKLSSFKSHENIHKKEDGSYYVVSANKASSVTL